MLKQVRAWVPMRPYGSGSGSGLKKSVRNFAPQGPHFLNKNFKGLWPMPPPQIFIRNQIFNKIGFLTWFGLVLRSDSESAWKIMQIRSLKSWFGQNSKCAIFMKWIFPCFFTFEVYFKVQAYQNRTQHERIPPGSYPEIFFARWEAPRNPLKHETPRDTKNISVRRVD